MDYFKEAFGGFAPQSDPDAALKLALDALVADHRVADLTALVTPDSNFGGVEGEPGWIIERREDGEILGYEGWPARARYRAYVDPAIFALAHPEFFCDRAAFYGYVRSIAAAYAKRHPEKAAALGTLRDALMHAPA